ncbi:MAG: dihydrolipoyl dehydrogenase [Gammaproteobacteria bacterium]|nr:dihydrolipoyl dehydrogenase [Gammaproteobacteria bacterium]
MAKIETVLLPDIGNYENIPVIELLVQPGEVVEKDQSLLTLESDKATMEIPSPVSGRLVEFLVKLEDKVSKGTPIARIEVTAETGQPLPTLEGRGVERDQPADEAAHSSPPSLSPQPSPVKEREAIATADITCDVLVLGAGPGGYTAAFRAADLGKRVVLVEKETVLGGVCLNVGCIPSKALLHVAQVINETREMADHGISFSEPTLDLHKLRGFKDGVIKKLTTGLAGLARQRKVQVVNGVGRFTSPHTVAVDTADGVKTVAFQHAIIAVGSRPVQLPFIPHDDPRVMDSTGALALAEIPKRLLVIGGGIIGLEMAQVYDALGAKITVVELSDTIIPGADKDITLPLLKRIKKRYEAIYLGAKVTAVQATPEGLVVSFEGKGVPAQDTFDRILVAVGRVPNGKLIDADKAGVYVDERGFIPADARMRTNVPHIYAIGDVIGQPMLAHKAAHEGKVAAEVICGLSSAFTPMGIPGVAYTDPEVAWVGKTEEELKREGIAYEKGVFPWAASGRSLALGRDEGLTKVLFCADTHRLLGAAIVGPNAGELIAEAALALEMGADMTDIGLTIHPHPTLSETLGFAAEMAEGTITDLLPPKKRH